MRIERTQTEPRAQIPYVHGAVLVTAHEQIPPDRDARRVPHRRRVLWQNGTDGWDRGTDLPSGRGERRGLHHGAGELGAVEDGAAPRRPWRVAPGEARSGEEG